MLHNEYLLAKICFDTEENEPLKVWGSFTYLPRDLNLSRHVRYRKRPVLPCNKRWHAVHLGRRTNGSASGHVLEVRLLHVRRRRDVLYCAARFPGMVWQFACLVPCRVLRDDIFDQSFRIHLQDLPKRVLLYRHCTWESSASKNREEKDVYGGPHHCD